MQKKDSKISDDILDVAKLENNSFKIQKEKIDLNELILSIC